ncbi:MAG: hypothetical protein RLZZ181_121 [Pseudomonadota bacterium]|jgi:hypothetical protein
MEKKTKKKTRRSKQKYPGLVKGCYSKIKQEFFDIDYVNKLTEEEKQWLNDFMNGDLGANTKNNPVFEEYEEKRECWKKNNARNRDIYSIARATGTLSGYTINPSDSIDLEESLIEHIDEGLAIDKISEEV